MEAINPQAKAYELAQAIVNSEIYQNYLKQAQEIKKYPELSDEITLLRKQQLDINREHMMGGAVSQEKIGEATLNFAKLNQDPRAAAFIEAEGKYIQLFNEIQEILAQALQATMEIS